MSCPTVVALSACSIAAGVGPRRNGATERANRDIAIGRGNWTFFGSDAGGRTAAILMSFIAMCKRNAVEPFAWFRDVLSRIATHPINRIEELLPHNWKALAPAANQA